MFMMWICLCLCLKDCLYENKEFFKEINASVNIDLVFSSAKNVLTIGKVLRMIDNHLSGEKGEDENTTPTPTPPPLLNTILDDADRNDHYIPPTPLPMFIDEEFQSLPY